MRGGLVSCSFHLAVGAFEFIECAVDDPDAVLAVGVEARLVFQSDPHLFKHRASLFVEFIEDDRCLQSFPLCAVAQITDQDRQCRTGLVEITQCPG